MTVDEAVANVSDGMTIGIGGWGSRRKPMAFVRALVRKGVKDLTVVSYGGLVRDRAAQEGNLRFRVA
jgi:acyl CoA:acetate/3-ketoacid CoA transferase alpha subunit